MKMIHPEFVTLLPKAPRWVNENARKLSCDTIEFTIGIFFNHPKKNDFSHKHSKDAQTDVTSFPKLNRNFLPQNSLENSVGKSLSEKCDMATDRVGLKLIKKYNQVSLVRKFIS